MRAQNLVLAVISVLEWAFLVTRDVRKAGLRASTRRFVAGCAFAGAMLAGFLPQLLVWDHYYGSMTRLLVNSWFMARGNPFVWEVLFSSRNGLFPWSPHLYVSVAGLAILVRRDARIALAALGAFALQTYVNASAWPWWAGYSFGQRRFLGMTVWLVLGTALVLESLFAWLRQRAPSRGRGHGEPGGGRVSQRPDGRWECPRDEHDGTGQALWALAGHAAMSGDEAWLREAWPSIERGADWLVSARRQTMGGGNRGQPHEGLLPEGYGETLFRWGYVLYHDFWGVAGLRVAATMAEWLGLSGLATVYREEHAAFQEAVDRAVDAAFLDGYIQAALHAEDTWDWGAIAALYP